jgi:hypothetical protein
MSAPGWCIRCGQERAVAPTRFCATCLKLELEENEQDAEVLVIALPAPDPYDVHIAIMRECYPPDPLRGISTVVN